MGIGLEQAARTGAIEHRGNPGRGIVARVGVEGHTLGADGFAEDTGRIGRERLGELLDARQEL